MAGCLTKKPDPIHAPVVAPAGPATAAVAPAIVASQDAAKEVLSKIAASAVAIAEINSGQPAGPRTTGVANEAAIIAASAGVPTDTDRLAAAQRAQIVAEGKTAEIAAAYKKASSEADAAKAREVAAQAALVSAQNAAEVEQAAQAAKFQKQLDSMASDANARIAKVQKDADDKIRAEQTRWVTIIFFGLSALCLTGGIVVLLCASSVPMFGPKAGFALIGSSLALGGVGIAINQIQNFLYAHPWVVGLTIAVVLSALAIAVGLVYSNHQHAKNP